MVKDKNSDDCFVNISSLLRDCSVCSIVCLMSQLSTTVINLTVKRAISVLFPIKELLLVGSVDNYNLNNKELKRKL